MKRSTTTRTAYRSASAEELSVDAARLLSHAKQQGAPEIRSLLAQYHRRLRRDVHSFLVAVERWGADPSKGTAVIDAAYATVHDLAALRQKIGGVQCKTRRARQGKKLVVASLTKTERGYFDMVAVVRTSDVNAISRLTKEQRRLATEAEADARAAALLLAGG